MAQAARDSQELSFNEPQLISPDELVLDSENPRLILGIGGKATDETIIRQLHREGELGELLQSISSNGYLDFEPLVVLRNGAKDRYTVLEGNRRLAALKLFRDSVLAERLEISVPTISTSSRESLEKIRVIRGRCTHFHRFQAHQWSTQMGQLCESEICGCMV